MSSPVSSRSTTREFRLLRFVARLWKYFVFWSPSFNHKARDRCCHIFSSLQSKVFSSWRMERTWSWPRPRMLCSSAVFNSSFFYCFVSKLGLSRRKIMDSPWCDNCGTGVEDCLHALWKCPAIDCSWSTQHELAEIRKKDYCSFHELVRHVGTQNKDLILEKFATTC